MGGRRFLIWRFLTRTVHFGFVRLTRLHFMGERVTKASVGIKELAAILGISTGTVSRAVNNRPGVNPRTRIRVLEEARRSGVHRQ